MDDQIVLHRTETLGVPRRFIYAAAVAIYTPLLWLVPRPRAREPALLPMEDLT